MLASQERLRRKRKSKVPVNLEPSALKGTDLKTAIKVFLIRNKYFESIIIKNNRKVCAWWRK
jgi:hypothetical protein